MLEILAITGPIFLLIGTGFAAVRSGLLERAGIRPLGTFVVNFALPAMLFKTMAERRLDEALHWDMVIAYGLGSLLMVALTLAFTRFVQRRDLLTGAVFSMGTAMANSSFVGFPIALQLFGPQAGAALAAYAVVESVVMFPFLYVLGDAAASGRQPLRVLVDSRQRLQPEAQLFSLPGAVLLARQQRQGEWPEQVEQLELPLAESGKLDLQALLRELGQRGINELWVEAGRQLAGALVAQQLVDELIVYLAPKVLGDTALGLLALPPLEALSQAPQFSLREVCQIGDDLRLTLQPRKREE